MPSQTVRLINPTGLHARPAKVFAEAAGAAAKTGLTVKVAKGAAIGDNAVNARSVLSVLTLDCHHGDAITISVEGDDEAAAADALATLVTLVETGIGEDIGEDIAPGGDGP